MPSKRDSRLKLASLTAISLLLLSACASDSLVIQRYMLPRSDAALSTGPADKPLMIVSTPRLAGLIDRTGLLMQISEIQVHEAKGHQWADDLAEQLKTSLQHALADNLTAWQLTEHHPGRPAAKLVLSLQQFQGRYDGQAIISGHWQLASADGQLIEQQHFWLAEALSEHGYPELVLSLDRAWQKLAHQISERLNQLQPG